MFTIDIYNKIVYYYIVKLLLFNIILKYLKTYLTNNSLKFPKITIALILLLNVLLINGIKHVVQDDDRILISYGGETETQIVDQLDELNSQIIRD